MKPRTDVPLPHYLKDRPKDSRGFVVPWFVHDPNDFRVVESSKITTAIFHNVCWVCGQPLLKEKTFVIGPMCAINRISSDPPSHHECALYSAKVCPFLSRPKMVRNEKDLPKGAFAPGVMIKRNPGLCLLWTLKEFQILNAPNGLLFALGDPISLEWFAEGRTATNEEISKSIETGFPLLSKYCVDDVSANLLRYYVKRAQKIVPVDLSEICKVYTT